MHVEDARNKHFRVNLVLLTNAELEKHLNMKPDNDIKMDNRDNVIVAYMKVLLNGVPPSIMLKVQFLMVGVFMVIQQTATKRWNVKNPNEGMQ